MTRSELIHRAIDDAYAKADETTVINTFDGSTVSTRYFRKGKRIWCKETCGSITSESVVYAVNDKPYTRWGGRKWYLTDDHLEAMKRAME